VHFWDFATVNCLRVIPYLKVWHGRYADKGLVLLGILAPEFDFGRDPGIARQAVEELGLPFPVALDASFATWDAYENRFWPASFLVDKDGLLADCQFGEGGYAPTETSIQTLLREVSPRLVLPRVIEPLRPEDAGDRPDRPVTPEIYLGFRRGRIGNPQGFRPGEVVQFVPPPRPPRDVSWASGDFRNLPECLEHSGFEEGSVSLSYPGSEVHLVAAPGQVPGTLVIEQDGLPLPEEMAGESVVHTGGEARVIVDSPRAWHLVRNPLCSRHTLTVRTRSPGLRLYGFSFLAM
jgi:hypothetical protein